LKLIAFNSLGMPITCQRITYLYNPRSYYLPSPRRRWSIVFLDSCFRRNDIWRYETRDY